jgi:RNA polymerase sigma-70 factor (ECF subfamily)
MSTWPNHIEEPEKFYSSFREGDPEAFKRIFELYFKLLYNHVRLIVGNKAVAEDIIANVFCKLYDRRARIAPRLEHLTHYLYAMANREAIDHFRQQKKKIRCESDFRLMSDEFYTDARRIEKELTELTEETKAAIDRLPPAQKNILQLYFFKGHSTREIANDLGLSEQTVRNQKSKALDRLRRRIWYVTTIRGGS